jgi:hypothetical protein
MIEKLTQAAIVGKAAKALVALSITPHGVLSARMLQDAAKIVVQYPNEVLDEYTRMRTLLALDLVARKTIGDQS